MIDTLIEIGGALALAAVFYWSGLRDGRQEGDEIIEAICSAHEGEVDEAFRAGYAACRAVADGDDVAQMVGPEHAKAQRQRGEDRIQ